jgi:transcription elongation factor SPT5
MSCMDEVNAFSCCRFWINIYHFFQLADMDLFIITEASRGATLLRLKEQSGVYSVVDSINQCHHCHRGWYPESQRPCLKRVPEVQGRTLKSGQKADKTGLVVNTRDSIVTFLSDMSYMDEVNAFSRCRFWINIYLFFSSLQVVCVIFKTERNSFLILDQDGQVRLVGSYQI